MAADKLTARASNKARGGRRSAMARGELMVNPADAGLALAGLPERVSNATLYVYAGDRSVYHRVRRSLLKVAQERAVRNGWPADTPLTDLVDLAMMEADQPAVGSSRAWHIVLGVTPARWAELEQAYFEVAGELTLWHEEGLARLSGRSRS